MSAASDGDLMIRFSECMFAPQFHQCMRDGGNCRAPCTSNGASPARRRLPNRALRRVLVFGFTGALVSCFPAGLATAVQDAPLRCGDPAYTAEALNQAFDRGPGGLSGADYPRAIRLNGWRTLWLFQDAFIGSNGDLRHDHFVHNVGLVQQGGCFKLLTGGTPDRPTAWLGGELTAPLRHWMWPLDAEFDDLGRLHILLAEMQNPNGTGASLGAVPVGTWEAVVRAVDLKVISVRPAVDPSSRLYGWSVVSDSRYTYLYGYCYQQFLADKMLGANPECSPDTYLARVPRHQFDQHYEYWDGADWSTNAHAAAPVLSRGVQNPMSIMLIDGQFVSVTKLDDWWGDTLFVDVAPRASGPWTTVESQEVPTRCGARCDTYGASLVPWLDEGQLVVAISNNAWDMDQLALSTPGLYRPSFLRVPFRLAS